MSSSAGLAVVSLRMVTEMVDSATWPLSVSCLRCNDSSSLCRLVSSPSIWVISDVVAARSSRARTRSTLARWVARRDSTSTTCSVTSSDFTDRLTSVVPSISPMPLSSASIRSAGTRSVTDPLEELEFSTLTKPLSRWASSLTFASTASTSSPRRLTSAVRTSWRSGDGVPAGWASFCRWSGAASLAPGVLLPCAGAGTGAMAGAATSAPPLELLLSVPEHPASAMTASAVTTSVRLPMSDPLQSPRVQGVDGRARAPSCARLVTIRPRSPGA